MSVVSLACHPISPRPSAVSAAAGEVTYSDSSDGDDEDDEDY